MKVTTALVFISSIALASSYNLIRQSTPSRHEIIDFEAQYALEGIRGLFVGYESGFFKDHTQSKCLNDDVIDDIVKVIDIVQDENFQFMQIMAVMNDLMALYNNVITDCRLQSLKQIATFCQASADRCTLNAIIMNGQRNMFALMGRATDFSTAFQNFPPKDPRQCYDLAFQMGNDIGEVLRLIIGYN